MENKKICVFCSSSDALRKPFYDAAEELGIIMGNKKYTLIHGGGQIGLMGAMGRSVKANGGKVIGVIPEKLNKKGIVSENDDEIIVTKDMGARKAKMCELADAFIALPGGFGTLEEILEVITLKQLKYHTKPIVFINSENFYYNLFSQFEILYQEKFAKEDYKKLYAIVSNAAEAIEYIEKYNYEIIQDKWFL